MFNILFIKTILLCGTNIGADLVTSKTSLASVARVLRVCAYQQQVLLATPLDGIKGTVADTQRENAATF